MLTPDQLLQQGRYKITNLLGQNGTGAGYEAFDNVRGASVMLKEIHDTLNKVTTPAQLESRKLSFADEAQTLVKLKHESLLQIQDSFSEVDRHYLVAENVEGSTLGEHLEKKKAAFELAVASAWIDQLLDAVNYLHQQIPPIVHRDVRPASIKLCSNGKIKLMIFGAAQSAQERRNAAQKNSSFDAAALPYSPLEQIWEDLDAASKKVILNSYDEESEKILEQSLDARSDIYALGATAYHLLTGRVPVDALTRSIDLLEGKLDPLPSPFELNPSVPPEISDVIMTSLEIRREHRFSSAAIMRQVLRTAFVRVKEREQKTVKKDEDVLEIPVPETRPPVKAPVRPENPAIEDDQKRQLELIKQQLREAEARRLEAERRAAEAEKRLLEKEAKIFKVKDMHVLQSKESESAAKEENAAPQETPVSAPAPKIAAEAPAAETKFEKSFETAADDFGDLFAQPEKDGGTIKKMGAAAGLLVVVGLAVWAVWTFALAKPAGQNQAATPAAAVATPAPEPQPAVAAAENQTTPAETAPETSEPAPVTAEPETSGARPKPVAAAATPAPAKKQNIATTKTPAEKKPVTLDDLLKDN